MSQGKCLRNGVIFESRRENFSHAVLGKANANLELLHITWVRWTFESDAVIRLNALITYVYSARERNGGGERDGDRYLEF
jgi:hypothetical protein